jgi:hypothetical protein
MDSKRKKVFQNILGGIRFLADESERNGFSHVASLLRLCAKNACAVNKNEITHQTDEKNRNQ